MHARITTWLATGLAAALLPGVGGAHAAPEAPHRAGPADQLVRATATFGTRATGMPAAGSQPHQRFVAGSTVTLDYGYDTGGALTYSWSIDAAVEAAAPPPAPPTYTGLGFGVLSAGTCAIDTAGFDVVSEYGTGVTMSGYGDAATSPRAAEWDCAVLFTTDRYGGAPTYDAYVSPLDVVTDRPEIALRAPRKDRLVRRVWTEVPVTVDAGASTVDATDVVITGAGKGVKVRRLDVGPVSAGDEAEVHVWVKLVRPRATARLTLAAGGQRLATDRVRLRSRRPPAPPRAGRWSGGGAVFSVAKGTVRGFRVTTQTTCGVYPDLPTTTTTTYDFPTVAIPRNNEVSKGDSGNRGSDAAYSTYLRLRFVSPTKVTGTFTYLGPDSCRAIAGFTAKRGR